eukprot:scaffold45186_cov33-Prasinocladus_malaysianus.AAC.2
MVREAAKEASEVVFSSVTMQGAASAKRNGSGPSRIQGFGSDQAGGGLGSSGSGPLYTYSRVHSFLACAGRPGNSAVFQCTEQLLLSVAARAQRPSTRALETPT